MVLIRSRGYANAWRRAGANGDAVLRIWRIGWEKVFQAAVSFYLGSGAVQAAAERGDVPERHGYDLEAEATELVGGGGLGCLDADGAGVEAEDVH